MGKGNSANLLRCFGKKSKKEKTRDVDDYTIAHPIAQYDPEAVRLSMNKVSY
jgi:hypothetical protein